MDGECNNIIIQYVENNKEIFPIFEDEDAMIDYFIDLGCELMGSSEYYDFRVCQKVTVTYSPENIYLEKIEI